MPVHPWNTSFTTGEISAQLLARTDWERYKNAAGVLRNFVVRPYGGVARRAGLSYLGAAADQDARCRLIDFRVSETVAYVLEFSDLSLRVWRDRALVPGATLATPYAVADLRALRSAQSADVMYLCHPDYPVHKLARVTPTTFTLTPVQFDAPPTIELGIQPAVGLTLSATTGTGVTVTASGAYWLDGDAGRHLRVGQGVGIITDVTSATTATLDVLDPFASTAIAGGTWTLEDSPQVTLSVLYAPALGFNMNSTTGSNVLAEARAPGATFPTAFFTPSDVGLTIHEVGSGTGRAMIAAMDAVANYIRIDIHAAFSVMNLPPGQWAIEGSGKGAAGPMVHLVVKDGRTAFHPEEQSGYLRLLGGLVEIRSATATEVFGRLVSPFTPDIRLLSPPGAWSREVSAWSAARGYPGCVAFNQSRLWFAGSRAQPDTIWGSVTGDYELFALGPDDDDAVEYALAVSSGMNLIRWVKGMAAGSTTGLAIGTNGAEISLEGGQEAPLTPSNVRARERTYYGCDFTVDALQTNNLVVFLQRGARRIREFTYALEQDAFVAPDLLLTAEHLSRPGIVEMVHANSPDSLLFALTGDGILLACAYERPESVVAWTHHVTQGVFESICVIPNSCGTGDECWVAVARTLDGEVRRSIEVFDGRLNTDAALVYEGTATGAFTGLGHLAGAPVKAIDQDTRVYDCLVSAGGEITLPAGATATTLEVGLHYTATLETLRPELAGPQGTVQARRKHWSYTVARLFCTKSRLLWNGMHALELPEGTPPGTDYTGDSARATNFGWAREGILTLQTLDPLPCTVLGITGAIAVEDA